MDLFLSPSFLEFFSVVIGHRSTFPTFLLLGEACYILSSTLLCMTNTLSSIVCPTFNGHEVIYIIVAKAVGFPNYSIVPVSLHKTDS